MSRETILIILGVLVALSPWSGLPPLWMEIVLVMLGLGIIAIAVTLRGRKAGVSLPAVQYPSETVDTDSRPNRPYIS
jgi:hypothetical protein